MRRTRFLVVLAAASLMLFASAMPARAATQAYQRLYLSKPDGSQVFIFTTPGKAGLNLLLEKIFQGWLGLETVPEGTTVPPVQPPARENKPPVPPSGGQSVAPPETGRDGYPQNSNDSTTLRPEEARMLQLVNAERTLRGLRPLNVDFRLVDLARKKSQDMVDKNYFGHISPTYGSPFDMMKAAGIEYRLAGENLAGAPDVDTAHRALMNSEGHRRNILNPDFTKIGIGVAKGGPYGMMFTQMFIGD